MSTRAEAMRRHPAYQARILRLIEDARDEQAMDVANRGLAEAELHAGGPLRPARQVPVAGHPVVGVLKAAVAGFILYGLIFGMALVGQFVGGWPL